MGNSLPTSALGNSTLAHRLRMGPSKEIRVMSAEQQTQYILDLTTVISFTILS